MVAFPSESPDILSETCVTGVVRAALRRPLRRRATLVRLARSLPVATLFAPRVKTTKPIDRHPASYALSSYDLSHRRFDDGNVLFRRSAAYSDAGDHLALAGERHAAAHRGVSTASDGEEGIEGRAWLHKRDEVSRAHADEGRRVGLSLGELEGERGRSGHAVGENDVAVDVDDGNRDGHVLFCRLGLDAVSDVLRDGEQVHGRVLPFRK